MPTIATTTIGQNPDTVAKLTPVAAISAAAASSSVLVRKRCAVNPSASVSAPDPSSVAVAMTPTSKAVYPSDSRYTGNSRLM